MKGSGQLAMATFEGELTTDGDSGGEAAQEGRCAGWAATAFIVFIFLVIPHGYSKVL